MINKRERRIAGEVSLRRGDELDSLNKRRDHYQMGNGKVHSWKQEGKLRMWIWLIDADRWLEAHVGFFQIGTIFSTKYEVNKLYYKYNHH